MRMLRTIQASVAVTAALCGAAHAQTTVIQPSDIRGMRHLSSGPAYAPDYEVNVASGEWTAMEFDISTVSTAAPITTLGLGVGGQTDLPRGAFDIFVYRGDGVVSLDDDCRGTSFRLLTFNGELAAVNVDVTAPVQAALDAGDRYIGFCLSGRGSEGFRIGESAGYQTPVLTQGGYTAFVPVIDLLSPRIALQGGPEIGLEVRAHNLAAGAVIRWSGEDLPTGVMTGPLRLVTAIDAERLAIAGTVEVTVANPEPGGGVSAPAPFVIGPEGGIVYFVDDDAVGDPAPGDPNLGDPLEDGTAAHPFDDIQEAVRRASPADTVKIAPGAYQGPLHVGSPGCRIEGSGRQSTFILGKSGVALRDPFARSRKPLELTVTDLTFQDGSFDLDYEPGMRLSLQRVDILRGDVTAGAFESVDMQDVNVVSGSIRARSQYLGSRAPRLSMTGVRIEAGDIHLDAGTDASLGATVERLDAPASTIFMSTGTPGSCGLTLTASTVAGINMVNVAGGLFTDAAGVRFTRGGVEAFGRGYGLFVLVADSVFERGGIRFTGGGGSYDSSQMWGTVSVERSEFLDEGIDYIVGGGHSDSFDYLGDDYGLNVDSSRFRRQGITARVVGPGLTQEAGIKSSEVRLTNNIFEPGPAGISVAYEYFPGGPADVTFEAIHNTFQGRSTGISIDTEPHATGFLTLSSTIRNNIISEGATGIEVRGTDDHVFDVAGNDVAVDGTGYVGDLPDRTGLNGNISAEPLFLDAASGDYRLAAGSPCIDAGVAGVEIPVTDFAGRARPQDGDGDGTALPDIGAFEALADGDRDGFGGDADCDDADPAVHPGAAELPGNAIDEDCDGRLSCDPAGSWARHGSFVACVARACEALAAPARVSHGECREILPAAAGSGVGRKP